MRCFLSIELPDEVRDEILRIQKLLPEAKMKLVEPENLHLTLKFLGELSDFQVNKVKEALKQIKFDSFKVHLNSVGAFPSLSYVRVVWVDVLPKERLVELQQKIEAALHEQGFRKDRSFETHITLARVKFIKNKEEFVKKLKEIKVEPIEFQINSFVLRKSTLAREGPVYEDIFKFELK